MVPRRVSGAAHRGRSPPARTAQHPAARGAGLRFPVLKSLDQFDWNWPKKINRPQIQNLFRLRFIEDNANVIFISNVGLGKSHLSIAIGHSACLHGYSVLFTTAVDIVNSLSGAQAHGGLVSVSRYRIVRFHVFVSARHRRNAGGSGVCLTIMVAGTTPEDERDFGAEGGG